MGKIVLALWLGIFLVGCSSKGATIPERHEKIQPKPKCEHCAPCDERCVKPTIIGR